MPALRACGAALLLIAALGSTARGQQDDIRLLGSVLRSTHWISYAPTGFYPREKPPKLPGEKSVLADLSVIRDAGFDGIVTYGIDVEMLPDLAARQGFKAMLLGVWNPLSQAEIKKAISAVKRNNELIVGIVVGNEGLLRGEYTIDRLCDAMRQVQQATGKPVSSTEPVDILAGEQRLAECSTFLSVNAHPYFSGRKTPHDAVQWTVKAWDAIRELYPGKLTIFKEVGLPTGGDIALSEATQREYYVELARTPVVFSYFEAFDATPRFKKGLIEQSWGLWRADRTPKPLVGALPWKKNSE